MKMFKACKDGIEYLVKDFSEEKEFPMDLDVWHYEKEPKQMYAIEKISIRLGWLIYRPIPSLE